MDTFYTPTEVAEKMVNYASLKDASIIADFTVGDGQLLRAAQNRYPQAHLIGTDIDKIVADEVKINHPEWKIEHCDFLEESSTKTVKILSEFNGEISLILLNPPFSCRGTKYNVLFEDEVLSCSLGLVFVIKALQFLSPGGQLIALLPAGCLTNQKDRNAWEILHQFYKIEKLQKNGNKTFSKCAPETFIVRFTKKNRVIKRKSKQSSSIKSNVQHINPILVKMFNGRVSMNLVNGCSSDFLPLVHTTELEKERLNLKSRFVKNTYKSIKGPAVLIPRVGVPKQYKIKLYLAKKEIVLSDCVNAILCKTTQDAQTVHQIINENWLILENHYHGTCAKYITKESIEFFLNNVGIQIEKSS